MYRHKPTLSELKRTIIGDSLERKRQLDQLIQLVREAERERVLSVTDKARSQGEH